MPSNPSKRTRVPKSAPNSAIDTATPQADHRRIAAKSVTESRAPSQILKDSQKRALSGN